MAIGDELRVIDDIALGPAEIEGVDELVDDTADSYPKPI